MVEHWSYRIAGKLNNEIEMARLNSSDEYEFLCKVILTKDKFPIAFENKVQELIEECAMTREKA